VICYAQEYTMANNTLKWVANSFENLANSDHVGGSSYFISSPTKIEWVQKNGSKTYTFNIVSTQGIWTDVRTEGKFSADVRIGDRTGTIYFSRVNNSVTIEMKFVLEGKNIMPYKFNIEQIEDL